MSSTSQCWILLRIYIQIKESSILTYFPPAIGYGPWPKASSYLFLRELNRQSSCILSLSLSLSKVCLLVLLYLSRLFPESSPNRKHFPQAAEKTVTQACSDSQIHAKWRGNTIFQLLRSLCLESKDHVSTTAHCHTTSTYTELSYIFTIWWHSLQKEG